MVKVKNDLTGQQFGRLIVIKQVEDYISPQGKRSSMWLCECCCEKHEQIIVRGCHLTNGHTKSCGCLHDEATIQRNKCDKKKYNTYDLSGEYGIGWTSNTNEEFWFELEDYDKIKNICWEGAIQNGMRVLTGYNPETKKQTTMHRLLGYLNYDHIDRNEFNNLKSNLRKANYSENAMNRTKRSDNTSEITGVWWHKKNKKWCADIGKNNNRTFLGSFANKEDAIRVRLQAEKERFGEFAPQQHLFEQYGI